jgi:hypothetical protein
MLQLIPSDLKQRGGKFKMENMNYSDELQHWGIKGMKWGVRRYQNKDGSLTPAGQKRYDEMSDDAKYAHNTKKKSVEQMSNAELKKLNERTRLEQEYDRLNPGTIKKGWKYVAGTVAVMGTALALYDNSNRILKLGKTTVSALLKKG